MVCEQEDVYALIQESDTDFNGNHFLFDYFITDIDLSDHYAKCDVPAAHFSKDLTIQYDEEEELYYVTVDFTAEETLKMPLGTTEIIVVVYNQEDKQQSLKKIPIKVLKKGNVLPITTSKIEQPLVATPGYAISQVIRTPAYDHDTLRHRDYPDQHPIAAITDLQDTLDSKLSKTDESDIVYGTDNEGNQTTYDKNSFGKVDDVKVGNTSVVVNKVATLGTMAGETASDYAKKTDVGNATLTIQENATTIDTFSANATVDKTINITVPTKASDVNALPDTTKYGATVTLSLNQTNYKVTLTLKDQDGNTLGQAQEIDLPLESVVVSGTYDSTNKKIVLTLQNGTTIDIPVGDLVAGLQTEITSSNKLSADLVDDTLTTNKFVTTAEKATWNSKQDAISDIETIRNNASAGKNASDTIATYGNVVTHNVSEFATAAQGAKADTAVQNALKIITLGD